MLSLLFLILALAPLGSQPAQPSASALYHDCGLEGVLSDSVFSEAYARAAGQAQLTRVLAIADMSRPSTEKRLFLVDLQRHELLLRTWVAHGKGSGGPVCRTVSDEPGSLCTSAGLYRVGEQIMSPKHGDALLLDGLDRGMNGHAKEREIIIHAADYVSESFINANGQLGRSWGCPAVSHEAMRLLLALLPQGSLLYIHA
ncbi:MAG: murein L,D-transpeptidase catalytic domain family protein [Flavobacteriales bacterium]